MTNRVSFLCSEAQLPTMMNMVSVRLTMARSTHSFCKTIFHAVVEWDMDASTGLFLVVCGAEV